ncbi:hypothetical protein ABFA07_001542 [Porites harrisoni]
MSDSGKILVPVEVQSKHQSAEKRLKQNSKAKVSCPAELRTLPAAFSLVESMKDTGAQMLEPTKTFSFGMATVSFGDFDA